MIRTSLALLVALTACDQSPGRVGAGAFIGTVLDVEPYPNDQLDILFVIDDSGSMEGQQAALAAAARDALFGQLAAELGGHLPDLHVGVTTSNAPLAPNAPASIPGCSAVPQARGGGGELVTSGCPGIDPGATFLVDEDDGAGGRTRNYQGDLADVFACMANVGTGGCGFEHTLEATARGVELNGPFATGFRRDDALLLVVIVSDEDDCSAADATLFGDPTADLGSPLGPRNSFRCFEFGITCAEPARDFGVKTACAPTDGGYLTPVAAIAARIRAAVADPSRVMVAGIHGGPRGVTVVPEPPPGDPTHPFLGTVCQGTDFEVSPALRLSAFAAEFPARWVLTPECITTMSAKLGRITRAATGVLARGTCLLGGAPDLHDCTVTRIDADGARADIPRCRAGDGDCYRLAPDAAACDYTDHHLRLVMPPALMPPGARVQVRCGP